MVARKTCGYASSALEQIQLRGADDIDAVDRVAALGLVNAMSGYLQITERIIDQTTRRAIRGHLGKRASWWCGLEIQDMTRSPWV